MVNSDVKVEALLMEHFFSLIPDQLEVSVRAAIPLERVPPDEAQVLLISDPIFGDEIVFDGRLLAIEPLEEVCIYSALPSFLILSSSIFRSCWNMAWSRDLT